MFSVTQVNNNSKWINSTIETVFARTHVTQSHSHKQTHVVILKFKNNNNKTEKTIPFYCFVLLARFSFSLVGTHLCSCIVTKETLMMTKQFRNCIIHQSSVFFFCSEKESLISFLYFVENGSSTSSTIDQWLHNVSE